MSTEPLSNEAQALSGVELYSPGVLAAYFILGNVPVGMALYGLNVARRGERWIGYVLLGSSLLALVLLGLAAISGRNLRGWSLLALVLGLGVWQIERGPYRRALRSGATPVAASPRGARAAYCIGAVGPGGLTPVQACCLTR